MKKFLLLLAYIWLLSNHLSGQVIDTVYIHSSSMNKDIPNLVILPAGYRQHTDLNYPVVYLLHGHGNRFSSWIERIRPDLDQLASHLDIIIVCPDGANSWYWDSPVNPAYRYETYVSQELINHIDSHYRTIKSREGRAITGYSMGGHGGLWLGFRHPDLFGACGSMSGGVDIRPFPDNWDMKKALGSYAQNPQRWDEHTVINQLPVNREHGPLAIIIDCGTEDFFYKVNEALHEKLLYYRIPHDYITRPGGHTQPYWNNAIEYQLLFFKKTLQAPHK